MKRASESFIDDIRLSRDKDGRVRMSCQLKVVAYDGEVLYRGTVVFGEAAGNDCGIARVFAKRLHKMVKEKIVRDMKHIDTEEIAAQIRERRACCD